MYELVQVSERCYYINCPAKIGIYVSEGNHVYLIDSGSDTRGGRSGSFWIKTAGILRPY